MNVSPRLAELTLRGAEDVAARAVRVGLASLVACDRTGPLTEIGGR